jgi:hypothetical protein
MLIDKITIDEPGYYRVFVSARAATEEPSSVGGRWAKDVGYAETWLLVGEHGGRATATYDESLLSDSVVHQPGVRRRLEGLGLRVAGTNRSRTQVSTHATTASLTGSEPQRRLVYSDIDANQVLPVAGAYVHWDIVDVFNNVTESYTGVTDANGMYPGPCILFPALTFARVDFALENSLVRVTGGNGSFIESDCDPSLREAYVAAPAGWMFRLYNEFIPFSRGLLNVERGQIQVIYDESFTGLAFYKAINPFTSGDYIKIGPQNFWGTYGRFTLAHEYGHAIHAVALGGINSSPSCPGTHEIFGYYNLGCAFSEGFADFVGATSQNLWNVGNWYIKIVDYTNNNWYNPGFDGSIQEAAVAAFFYDLTDSPGGDNGADEPWDTTFGERVAATIRDCKVRVGSVTVTRSRGVDDFVFCAERTVNTMIRSTYFQSRPSTSRANAIQTNATASPYWPQAAVRQVWQKDLYGLN